MNIESMIQQLEDERDRVNQALAALGGKTNQKTRPPKRHMSDEARKRISQAQKRRWAKQKRKKS
jgi:hypothetical protein